MVVWPRVAQNMGDSAVAVLGTDSAAKPRGTTLAYRDGGGGAGLGTLERGLQRDGISFEAIETGESAREPELYCWYAVGIGGLRPAGQQFELDPLGTTLKLHSSGIRDHLTGDGPFHCGAVERGVRSGSSGAGRLEREDEKTQSQGQEVSTHV